MSSTKKLIAIVGATGNQGGSVANNFLNLPNWNVRCITRSPSSEKAFALAQKGAEVVKADLSEPESLKPAFLGAHAIFLNTEFFETFRSLMATGKPPQDCSESAFDKELTDGKNAAMAAAATPTLERLVVSSLPSLKGESNGKPTRSFHPESKAAIVQYIETELPELAKKTSILFPGAFTTNPFLSPKPDPSSGNFVAMCPFSPQAKVAVFDPVLTTGPFVRALVEDEAPGIRLLAYNNNSFLSIREMVDMWAQVNDEKAHYLQVDAETLHQKMGLPYELLDAFEILANKGYGNVAEGAMRPDELKNPPVTQSYEEWLRATKAAAAAESTS